MCMRGMDVHVYISRERERASSVLRAAGTAPRAATAQAEQLRNFRTAPDCASRRRYRTTRRSKFLEALAVGALTAFLACSLPYIFRDCHPKELTPSPINTCPGGLLSSCIDLCPSHAYKNCVEGCMTGCAHQDPSHDDDNGCHDEHVKDNELQARCRIRYTPIHTLHTLHALHALHTSHTSHA